MHTSRQLLRLTLALSRRLTASAALPPPSAALTGRSSTTYYKSEPRAIFCGLFSITPRHTNDSGLTQGRGPTLKVLPLVLSSLNTISYAVVIY